MNEQPSAIAVVCILRSVQSLQLHILVMSFFAVQSAALYGDGVHSPQCAVSAALYDDGVHSPQCAISAALYGGLRLSLAPPAILQVSV